MRRQRRRYRCVRPLCVLPEAEGNPVQHDVPNIRFTRVVQSQFIRGRRIDRKSKRIFNGFIGRRNSLGYIAGFVHTSFCVDIILAGFVLNSIVCIVEDNFNAMCVLVRGSACHIHPFPKGISVFQRIVLEICGMNQIPQPFFCILFIPILCALRVCEGRYTRLVVHGTARRFERIVTHRYGRRSQIHRNLPRIRRTVPCKIRNIKRDQYIVVIIILRNVL